jgi:hypothetical protein
MSAKHTVFVLFHGVGNMYGPRHDPWLPGLTPSILALLRTLESCQAGLEA